MAKLLSVEVISSWKGVHCNWMVASNICYFLPLPKEMIQFDAHMFQMGCFNQLVKDGTRTTTVSPVLVTHKNSQKIPQQLEVDFHPCQLEGQDTLAKAKP